MNTIVTNYGIYKMQPLHDRILVRRIEESAASLIIIPDTARESTKLGEVVAAGPKAFDVKEGDIVLLPGIASKYPDWESCEMMLIRLADVGGVFDSSEA